MVGLLSFAVYVLDGALSSLYKGERRQDCFNGFSGDRTVRCPISRSRASSLPEQLLAVVLPCNESGASGGELC